MASWTWPGHITYKTDKLLKSQQIEDLVEMKLDY